MLVGRKNCRKIVQFLVEPLIKKRQKLIHFTLCEWIFCVSSIQIGSNTRRLRGSQIEELVVLETFLR